MVSAQVKVVVQVDEVVNLKAQSVCVCVQEVRVIEQIGRPQLFPPHKSRCWISKRLLTAAAAASLGKFAQTVHLEQRAALRVVDEFQK